MIRQKVTILRPGCWYADCRGGSLTSFLRYEGHSKDKSLVFFGYMTGYKTPYPFKNGRYMFSTDPDIEWFLPTDEDIKEWDLD